MLAAATSSARAQAEQPEKEACLQAHERAQVERLQGHFIEARAGLQLCSQRSCPRLVSKDCTTWLSEVEASLPTVLFAVVDSAGRALEEVRVSVGDKLLTERIDGRALPLDPGPRTLRFEAPGHQPLEQSLTVREGEKARELRVVLRPLEAAKEANAAALGDAQNERSTELTASSRERNPRSRWLKASYVLGGAALASFAIIPGAALRGEKLRQRHDEDKASPAERRRGTALFRTVNFSAGIGGVLLASSLASLWVGLSGRSPSTAQRGLGAYADGRGAVLEAWSSW
jgi:hypothetical protein